MVKQMLIVASFVLLCSAIPLITGTSIDPECAGQHEYLAQSTPACPVTCQTQHRARCLAIIDKPSCQCLPGFLRDNAFGNVCVRKEDCTVAVEQELDSDNTDKRNPWEMTPEEKDKIRRSCDPVSEVYTEIISACEPTCHAGLIAPQRCLALIERPSCACKSGFVREAVTRKCIHSYECVRKFI